jgi:hypothetical protein
VTNNGPDDATGVQVIDILPTGVAFRLYTASQGTYASTSGLWSVGNLANTANATLNIAATVNRCTKLENITNTAVITADQPDPDSGDNEASATIAPTSAAYCIYLPIILCLPFTDSFSSSSSGWPEVDNTKLKTQYIADEYRMLAKNANLQYAVNRQFAGYFTDYEIEVDAHWASGVSTGVGYGIIFGLASDDSRTYLFQINTDQQVYRLLRWLNNQWWYYSDSDESWHLSTVTDSGWVHSNAIYNDFSSNNRLRAIRDGSRIALDVNSTPLVTATDSTIASGRVGLSIQSYYKDPVYGTRNADAHFDDYSLNLCKTVAGVDVGINAESNSPEPVLLTGALPSPD